MSQLIRAAAAALLLTLIPVATATAQDLSPAENNKVAEKFFETAWNKGDFESVKDLLAPTVVDHSPVPGQSSGPEKFKEIVGMFRSAMPDVKMTIKDEIFNGDYVVHRWELEGTHKAPLFGVPATNKRLTVTGHTMLRFEDGKIAERWTQLSELHLLQQLGVVPTRDQAEAKETTAPKSVTATGADLSPEENNKIAEKFFESAWNQGDFDSVRNLLSPDVVDHSPVPAKSTGPEKFEEIVTSFRKAMPDLKMTIDGEVYAGDKIVHRWRINGTHTAPLMGVPATGKPIVLTGITIVRLKGGKFVERWTQLDELGLLKQLGVVPDQEAPKPEAKKAALLRSVPAAAISLDTEAAPANAGAVRPAAVHAFESAIAHRYYQQQATTDAPEAPGVSAAPAAAPPEMTREMNLLGIRSIKAPVPYPRPKTEDFWHREFMTGNWGGLRDELHDKGLDLNLAVFVEPFWNVSGGRKKDSATHSVGIASADLYTGKAGMWQDGQFHITLAYLNGGSIRDSVGAINSIVSSDALSTFRLFELWYGQKFDEGKQEIRIGKIFPYVMLGNIKSAYLFSNGSFNYPTFLGFGQSAAYFAAPFGIQYRYSPTPSWQFTAMIQDGYDDESGGTEKRNGLELSMNSDQGAEGTLEAWYKHNQAPGKTGLPGNYKAGVQFHTGLFKDKYINRYGRSLASYGDRPYISRGNYTVYGLAEQMVFQESADPAKKNEGLNVFLKGSVAPGDINTVSATAATGFNYVGLIPGRDRDVVTVGVSRSALGKAVRKSQRDFGSKVGDAESVVEAVYAAQIAPWWLLEFGAQRIIHPGGSSAIPDSTVVGISSRFSF